MSERRFNLADLFEIVTDTVPDRLALVAGDVRLTYAALDARVEPGQRDRYRTALASLARSEILRGN